MKLTIKIGNRIVELRNERKMSQEDLCYAAGLSRKTMHNIECGKCSVGAITLYKIVTALNLTVSEFFSPFSDEYEI